jgi:hypothetical protein
LGNLGNSVPEQLDFVFDRPLFVSDVCQDIRNSGIL